MSDLLLEAAEACRVKPGQKLSLASHDSAWLPKGFEGDAAKTLAEAHLQESRDRLAKAQEKLYASDCHALLVILQGLDAAGKDGIVKHVMSGVNPLGCQVSAFKAPVGQELEHDFLWRFGPHLPEKGKIGLFNRSYYEEVLVVRVHPEFLSKQKMPPGPRDEPFWKARYRAINDFEARLSESGTVIRKFMLNVSPDEQRRRLLERINDPAKFWKFNPADVEERAHLPAYRRAFEGALSATSTKAAPWYVIPADRKWFARTLVARIIVAAVEELKLDFPRPTAADRRILAAAKKKLGEG